MSDTRYAEWEAMAEDAQRRDWEESIYREERDRDRAEDAAHEGRRSDA